MLSLTLTYYYKAEEKFQRGCHAELNYPPNTALVNIVFVGNNLHLNFNEYV